MRGSLARGRAWRAADAPSVARLSLGAASGGGARAAAAAVGVPRSSRSLRSSSSSQRSSMPCGRRRASPACARRVGTLNSSSEPRLHLAVVAALEGDEGGVGVLVDRPCSRDRRARSAAPSRRPRRRRTADSLCARACAARSQVSARRASRTTRRDTHAPMLRAADATRVDELRSTARRSWRARRRLDVLHGVARVDDELGLGATCL